MSELRAAIYAAPGSGTQHPVAVQLRQRAESWLGRAADGGAPQPSLPRRWSRSGVDAITVDARRYGFHGTLKPPFRLAAGTSLDALETAVARFAAASDAVTLPWLAIDSLDGFLALVAGRPARELHAIADRVVTEFDGFRAPATADEVAKRRPETLSPRRRELLAQWGYPYVLDEFRFHLTLTDRLTPELRPAVREALDSFFAPVLGRDVPIDALAVFVEDAPGAPFRLSSIHPLRRPDQAAPDVHVLDSEGVR